MTLRRASNLDLNEWLHLRRALRPDVPIHQHILEMDALLREEERAVVLLVEGLEGSLDGFAEITLLSQFDGGRFSTVARLEGWYVRPEVRGLGLGRKLVNAAEIWARGMACAELISDAEVENTVSQQVHARLGFGESERVVLLRKPL